MRHHFSAFALACAMALPTISPAQEAVGPVGPVERESYHVPMWRNQYVTVIRVQIPGGRRTGYHQHTQDQFGVVVAPYPAKAYSQNLGQAPNPPRTAPLGEVSYTAFYSAPVTHRVINEDTVALDRYDILLNARTPAGFTPGSREAGAYTQVLDNARVRAWRLVLEPGQSAPAITQAAPGIRIVVRGGDIAEVSPGQPDRGMQLTPSELFWQEPGATRSVRNIGKTPIEVVEFELK